MHRLLWIAALCLACPAVASGEGPFKDVRPLLDYDNKAPLDVREGEVLDRGGVKVHDLTFASPRGGRVPAYLVVPPGKGPFAGVVFGHWGGGHRTEYLAEAALLAEAGAVSVLIDYPWERPAPWRKGVPNVKEPEKDLQIYAQAVVDLRRAFDLLLARPDIDAKRLGYVGHSYGAQWGAILVAVDKRMKTAVLMAGVPTGATVWGENDDPGMAEYLSNLPKEQVEKYVRVNSQLDAIRFVPHAAPVALFFQFARQERIMREPAMRRYAAAGSEPKRVKFYDAGHELFGVQPFADRAHWLEKQLGLAPVAPLLQKKLQEAADGR